MTTATRGEGAQPDGGLSNEQRRFVVHLGTLTLQYDVTPIKAERILSDAGFTPAIDYTLEALKGAQGPAEQEFASTDDVPLDAAHARQFRAVPRGGGRA